MTTDKRQLEPDPGRNVSRVYLTLAAGLFAWTAYVSFLPFDWQPVSLAAALSQLQEAVHAPGLGSISRTDTLANVLLFVPFGFALAGGLLPRTTGIRFAIGAGLVVLLGLSASVLVEFVQIFLRDRVSSIVDVAAHTAGCVIGTVLWAAIGRAFTEWTTETWSARSSDRSARVLAALSAFWILSSLAPFDVTFDLGELAARWRAGLINPIPFREGFGPATVADGFLALLSAIPLGAFALVWGRGRWPAPAATAVAAGLLLVTAVEAAQIFVLSHAADAGDIVYGGAGVSLGVWIARVRLGGAASGVPPPEPTAGWATFFVAVWSAALCAYYWVPYDFSVDADAVRQQIARMSLVPFLGYLTGSPLNALDDFSRTLALAVPLGVGVGLSRRNPARHGAAATVLAVLAAALYFSAIETGQIFLPTRIADPTDVMTGTAGFYVGIRLARWLHDGAGRRTRTGTVTPAGQPDTIA